MKKLLLSLGAIAAVAAPVAAVVSCGDSDTTFKADITGKDSYNLIEIKLQEDFGPKIKNIHDDTKTIKFDIKCGPDLWKNGTDTFKETLDLDYVRANGEVPTEFANDFKEFLQKASPSMMTNAGAQDVLDEMLYWFNL